MEGKREENRHEAVIQHLLQVLAFFDSIGFRSMLKDCCPRLAALAAEEILQRYRHEAQVAELAHALPSSRGGRRHMDVTLEGLQKMSFFPNEFQVALMQGLNTSSVGSQTSDKACQEVFGCKAFAGQVPTWSVGVSRLIYVLITCDAWTQAPSPHFGDFTVIFNNCRMKESVIIAAYDTGMYEIDLLGPRVARQPCFELQCLEQRWKGCASARHLGLPGPLDPTKPLVYSEHHGEWLQCLRCCSRTLHSQCSPLAQTMETCQPLTIPSGMITLSPDILANPPLPEAVKFAIAGFATLFGTEQGRDMQSMAYARSAALLGVRRGCATKASPCWSIR